MGFTYSSSVLPAKNPLFGWDGFGNAPKIVKNNFWELPISLNNSKFLKVPLYGGIYFRVLPYFYIKYCIKRI
ncbi:MAG: DUF3473 domain-containing protein [Saprospiraceae bacterium]|nr:DUF3473 domain-containing protein [Saprospiraceae bacterium]